MHAGRHFCCDTRWTQGCKNLAECFLTQMDKNKKCPKIYLGLLGDKCTKRKKCALEAVPLRRSQINREWLSRKNYLCFSKQTKECTSSFTRYFLKNEKIDALIIQSCQKTRLTSRTNIKMGNSKSKNVFQKNLLSFALASPLMGKSLKCLIRLLF